MCYCTTCMCQYPVEYERGYSPCTHITTLLYAQPTNISILVILLCISQWYFNTSCAEVQSSLEPNQAFDVILLNFCKIIDLRFSAHSAFGLYMYPHIDHYKYL